MNLTAPLVEESDTSRATTSLCCEPDEAAETAAGLSAEQATNAAGIFKALSDPVRLRLYSRIAGASEAVCVCDIDDVGVSQPTVSHHLRKLREAGLIDCERRGTWVYYWPVANATRAAHLAL
ncbi:metalloregulator ArsR/SmtB family transcription factor [Nocardioides zeae]|uniref:Metalloregulator ArsR/SmtB family transcription factor n=1 Tax=Nocardioides imazamoxiresistens TaxID=3231893 RepID=A0ABU3PV75_9ACTN|nr:metalloregulator ArsR/SmtB family transcription factor [Nocardioides zeae]MDT9593123.1 metalloregulator ArsR/SmtB family transcription factor [Nocardioides zeae]